MRGQIQYANQHGMCREEGRGTAAALFNEAGQGWLGCGARSSALSSGQPAAL